MNLSQKQMELLDRLYEREFKRVEPDLELLDIRNINLKEIMIQRKSL